VSVAAAVAVRGGLGRPVTTGLVVVWLGAGAGAVTVLVVVEVVVVTPPPPPPPPVGTTAFDGAEASLTPASFVATTVNRYETPGVKPLNLIDCGPALGSPGSLSVIPPGDAVAVYVSTGTPFDDGLKETTAKPAPASAWTSAGGAGTRLDVATACPPALVAVTTSRTDLPLSAGPRLYGVLGGPGVSMQELPSSAQLRNRYERDGEPLHVPYESIVNPVPGS
jgi:hypothetical protein